MKIVFDGQPLLNRNKTGIAYYEDGLLRELIKEYQQEEYGIDIFTFKHRKEKRNCLSEYFPRVKIQECSWFSGTLYRMMSLVFLIPYYWFFPQKRDITHFCNYVIPFGVKGKKIVTIHDLAFREYPETIRKRTMLMLKRNLRCSLKRADAIITDSEFTRKELQKYYDVPKESVYVVPCGVDTEKFFPESNQKIIDSVRSKYGIDKEYFLYLGTLEPRKNIEGLLFAYKLFIDKVGEKVDDIPLLVIAGGKGWMYEGIFEKAEKLGLNQKIVFTGYIAEEDKNALLSGAMLFCFPSFYEGFGMPPMEAMACGTPVLTSNSSSLEEITGNAACKVDPNNIEEMACALVKLYEDEDFRKDLIKKGFIQIKKYSWEKAVKKLYDVYCEVIKR